MKPATLFPDDFGDPTQSNPLPKPVHNGTETSRKAAERVQPKAKKQAVRVLEFIDSRGEFGATDKETQSVLEMPGDSQRPRRVWLTKQGYVKKKPDVTRDGSTVWVTTGKPLEIQERKRRA